MLGTLYEPPIFVQGQELSAYAITTLEKNTTNLESFVYGPQALPLDSWIFSPKAVPLSFSKPFQEIFFGSFLYRKGMTELTLEFHISVESAYSPTGNADAQLIDFNNNFSTKCGTTALAVLLGTDTESSSYYTNPTKGYRAVAQFNGESSVTPDGFSFTILNTTYSTDYTTYTANSTAGSVASGDKFTELSESRLKKITVDLTKTFFVDGEVVPIKVALLGSATDSKKTISANFTKTGSSKYPTMKDLNPSLFAQIRQDPTESYYIRYSTATAEVLVDLSYSTSWTSSQFPTSGLITAENLNAVSAKQKYLIERVKNRAKVLTGSFVFYPTYSNTAALYYPQFNSKDSTLLGKQPTISTVRPINSESVLASYSWKPQFYIYDRVGFNFKYITNTKTKSAVIVDFLETPMALPAYRQAYFNDDFITGYASSGGDSTAKTYPHFITASRYSTKIEKTLNQNYRSANLKLFQVRIPSTTTPVFDRRSFDYTDGFYFESGGYYEDTVYVDFYKNYENSVFSAWGLAKGADGYTSQVGLISEIPTNLIPSGLEIPQSTQVTQPILKTEVYTPVSGYNSTYYGYPDVYSRQHWNWVSPYNTAMSSRPILLHLADYSQRFLESKNSYIGFYFQYGCFVTNSSVNSYSTLNEYYPHVFYTVSGIHNSIANIDNRLSSLYQDMFTTVSGRVNNPYFYKEPIFWGQPITPLVKTDNEIIEFSKRLFYFTGRRTSDLLIVRGRNVTLYHGELTEVSRDSNPEGSFLPTNSIDWSFSNSTSIISGDYEGTVVVDLAAIPNLAYGSYYHLQGDSIVYAAEFFEEPS